MTLYDVTKTYGQGKGEETMWKTVEVVSKALEESMDEKAKSKLMRKVYGMIGGHHYNEVYAHDDMSKMYYVDKEGKKHYAPYWSDADMKDVYEQVKDKIVNVPFWDFAVALNMVKSDNCPLLRQWFPNATDEEMTAKVVEMTLNWLNDEDNPYGDHKVWGYLNSGK